MTKKETINKHASSVHFYFTDKAKQGWLLTQKWRQIFLEAPPLAESLSSALVLTKLVLLPPPPPLPSVVGSAAVGIDEGRRKAPNLNVRFVLLRGVAVGATLVLAFDIGADDCCCDAMLVEAVVSPRGLTGLDTAFEPSLTLVMLFKLPGFRLCCGR